MAAAIKSLFLVIKKKKTNLQLKTILVMAYFAFPPDHYFQMHSNWMQSFFLSSFHLSREKNLKRFYVIGSLAFQCIACTQVNFWSIVIFIKRRVYSKFSLKCSFGWGRLGFGKYAFYHCYLSGAFGGIGNQIQYHSARACVCVCMCFVSCYQCVLAPAI